jgi:HEAT repeat protein
MKAGKLTTLLVIGAASIILYWTVGGREPVKGEPASTRTEKVRTDRSLPRPRPAIARASVYAYRAQGSDIRRPEDHLTVELINSALGAPRAEERARALDLLVYREGGDGAAEALEDGLRDPEPSVRRAALDALKDRGDDIPVESVARVAWQDPSPGVRTHALALLVERAEKAAPASLRLALTDPEPSVREAAEALIADWHIHLDDAQNARHSAD